MQDRQDLLEGMRRTPNILSAFVKTIPEGNLHVRRGEGFWTVAEHVSHLARVQSMLLDRIHRFMNEDRPEFIPYIPGEDEAESDTASVMALADALRLFAHDRNDQLAVIEKADDRTWQKMGMHPEYENYSLYILVRHILMHDYWHMYRMEELWLTKDAYLTTVG